jgi:hypothetical protein
VNQNKTVAVSNVCGDSIAVDRYIVFIATAPYLYFMNSISVSKMKN